MGGVGGGKLRCSRKTIHAKGWMVSVGGKRGWGGMGGVGKLPCSREPTRAGGWMVSGGGKRGGVDDKRRWEAEWGGTGGVVVVSFDVHANQLTHKPGLKSLQEYDLTHLWNHAVPCKIAKVILPIYLHHCRNHACL